MRISKSKSHVFDRNRRKGMRADRRMECISSRRKDRFSTKSFVRSHAEKERAAIGTKSDSTVHRLDP